jgi:hypothetical protein
MRSLVLLILILFSHTIFSFADESKAKAALEAFKSLEGKWTSSSPSGEERNAVYEIVAGGSAVQETFTMGKDKNLKMITLYHLDGNQLMLTHYCIAQNQPRMRAVSISDDLKQINFDFLDATNLPDSQKGHMYKAEFHFIDSNKFTSKWTFRENGADKMIEEETFTRVK